VATVRFSSGRPDPDTPTLPSPHPQVRVRIVAGAGATVRFSRASRFDVELPKYAAPGSVVTTDSPEPSTATNMLKFGPLWTEKVPVQSGLSV
jgi:hypothetical protein